MEDMGGASRPEMEPSSVDPLEETPAQEKTADLVEDMNILADAGKLNRIFHTDVI
jgi:hypothetical protein